MGTAEDGREWAPYESGVPLYIKRQVLIALEIFLDWTINHSFIELFNSTNHKLSTPKAYLQ